MDKPTPKGDSSGLRSAEQNADQELHRKLTQRQLTMIAIGGAIGVGLFLGSSVSIQLAGPGVIVSYLLGAGIAMVIAYALAEMAVVNPVAASFGICAERYLNPWAGFTVRVTYALIQIIAIGAEVTAVAIYFAFWFPHLPQWIWVAGASAGLVLVNALHVGRFGEFEYWFALIKVVAIVAFILVGIGLIAGLGPGPAIGLKNLTAYGGFLPHGWSGVWLGLTLAITSYMGVEVIAVGAGEAQQPETSIPQAMRSIVFRLIIFYVFAIVVMVAMVPWTKSGGTGITASPFVRAFQAIGIPYAAALMNMVVITAALSSCNTDLYLSTRMLFSLARGHYAPQGLGELTRSGVPTRALAVSTGGMLAAILLAIYAPARAFLLLYGTAVAGMFFVWIVILVSHLRFRRVLQPDRLARLPLKLPLHPVPTLLAIVALLGIGASTFFVSGLEYTVPAFLPVLCLISLAYWRVRRRRDVGAVAAAEPARTAADSQD